MDTLKSDLKCWLFVCFTIIIFPSIYSKQYREDYAYNSKTDAFYKFHMEQVLYSRAKTICSSEGATLMVPTSDEDLTQAHSMFKLYPDIRDMAWIGNDGKEHESAEETPIIKLDEDVVDVFVARGFHRIYNNNNVCDMIKRNGEVNRGNCREVLSFICKVDAKDAVQDAQCKVFDTGYKYYESVGSCYKIPSRPMSWNEAYSECQAVGAHLVVINSRPEQIVVYNLTNEARNEVPQAAEPHFYFAGFRAEKKTDGSPVVFKTIFNQTLEEAGFGLWDTNEPNNSGGNEYCGAIFKNLGNFNDYDCSKLLGFVCEKEIGNAV